ncbi:hypothetical protein ID866_12188 [Astraeus odoratus]|nr:hypothetical protein ID866_12188 [Astraeus odoratus]
MSMHKLSMITGTPAAKTVNWSEVPDEELAMDLDNMDLAEEVERCQKEEEERQQKEAEAEQKQKDEERKRAGAGQMLGIKKRSACRSCMKAKERCKWPEMEMTVSRAGTSPQGREHKKQVKKAANKDDDNEVVILSSQKAKQHGGSKLLEEVTDHQWGELIQVVSTHMDMANSHLERIASMAQSNGWKMQCHYMLMEGLVGQQQLLLSTLVEIAGAVESGGAKGTTEGAEEPQEP